MKKKYITLSLAISMALAGNTSIHAITIQCPTISHATECTSSITTDDEELTAAQQELQEAITNAEEVYGDGSSTGAETLNAAITDAKEILANTESTVLDLTSATTALGKSVLAFRIANSTATAPTVVTGSYIARGSTMAFGRSTVSGVATSEILEQGFCWSTDPTPTVLDNRSTAYFSSNGNVYKMTELQPSTVYYVRAYAITTDYAVGYGDIVKVITIPTGNTTWTYNDGGGSEANARIRAALTGGAYYYNNFTSINGLNITCKYGSSTPTADCSYGGSMRVGPSSSYQATGTILHEMAHAVGVGTHSVWYGPSSPMRANGSKGNWLGDRATKVVQFLENDETAVLKGDATHMWPYGINGAHEDTKSEFLYIGNALIVQALGEDGLPPTGGFCTPAYTLESEENVKYYIKNASTSRGLYSKYLINSSTNRLRSVEMTADEALANASAAWYIEFDPTTCLYILKNAATGLYVSYQSTGTNGITLKERTNATANDMFQIMMARESTELGTGATTFSNKPYWIIHPTSSTTPPCLASAASGSSTTSSFDLSGETKEQNWHILTADETTQLHDAVNSILLSDLRVDGTTISGFNNDTREYTIDVSPTATPQVTATVGPTFSGTLNIDQATTLPGSAVITLTSESGETETFTITFNPSYIYNWDGQGGSSAPTAYGWNSTPSVTWSTANGSSGCRYMDPGNGEYTDYKYSGTDYADNRILWIRYNNSEKFTYSFSGMTAGHTYTLAFKYGWHNNGSTAPQLTIGTYQVSDSILIEGSDSTFSTSYTKRQMKDFQKTFSLPENSTETDFYLAITCRLNNDVMIALGDMSLVDNGTSTDIQTHLADESEFSLATVNGGIKINAPTATTVMVSNISGQLHYNEKVQPGITNFTLAPGVYIVNGIKAIVK